MKTRLIRLAALLALGVGGGLAAQVRQPTEGEIKPKRLYPKTANPDGTLNCYPVCDLLGPCC